FFVAASCLPLMGEGRSRLLIFALDHTFSFRQQLDFGLRAQSLQYGLLFQLAPVGCELCCQTFQQALIHTATLISLLNASNSIASFITHTNISRQGFSIYSKNCIKQGLAQSLRL